MIGIDPVDGVDVVASKVEVLPDLEILPCPHVAILANLSSYTASIEDVHHLVCGWVDGHRRDLLAKGNHCLLSDPLGAMVETQEILVVDQSARQPLGPTQMGGP